MPTISERCRNSVFGLDDNPELLQLSSFMLDYPFADRLYPRALEVIGTWTRWGCPWCCPTAMWYSSRARSSVGHLGCSSGRVLIYVHKERALDRCSDGIRRDTT